MTKIRTYTPENASKHTMIMERCATKQPTTPASIVRIFNPLSHFGKAIKLYNLNKTIQILYVTFSLPIQIKRQTTWQLFVYFVDKATKMEIVNSDPKVKIRVHPRSDSKNSDGTPFWIQNDRAHPTNLLSSTCTKNSLQNSQINFFCGRRRPRHLFGEFLVDFLVKIIAVEILFFGCTLSKSAQPTMTYAGGGPSGPKQTCVTTFHRRVPYRCWTPVQTRTSPSSKISK